MIKRIVGIAATACLLVGTQALAQTKVHTESKTKETGPGANTKIKGESVVGTVKEYEAGKKIKISGPNDRIYSFDLDGSVHVDGVVTVGQMARVDSVKENGRDRVTVIAPFGIGIRSSIVKTRPVASAASRDVHMKAEATTHKPGANVKTKTEVVIGTVKEYEPGKKIKVTGPNDEDVSFDLDESVTMNGPVAVGQRVKVEYTKGDLGNHVTVLSFVKGGKGR
jgi:ribosomal 50S subunit-recycling heat shock protein